MKSRGVTLYIAAEGIAEPVNLWSILMRILVGCVSSHKPAIPAEKSNLIVAFLNIVQWSKLVIVWSKLVINCLNWSLADYYSVDHVRPEVKQLLADDDTNLR